MKRFASAALLSVCLLPAAAWAGWILDLPSSGIRFRTTTFQVVSVQGGFDRFSGKVVYDEKDITKSSAEITIDVASIHSGIGLRDSDLRGRRFIDVARYPTAVFRSKKIVQVADGKLKVTGDLTLHGVTKEVVLDVQGPTVLPKDSAGKEHVGGKATGTISREMFRMGGLVGSDTVELEIDIDLIRVDESP